MTTEPGAYTTVQVWHQWGAYLCRCEDGRHGGILNPSPDYLNALEACSEALEKHHEAAKLIGSRIYVQPFGHDEAATAYADAVIAGTTALARLHELRKG